MEVPARSVDGGGGGGTCRENWGTLKVNFFRGDGGEPGWRMEDGGRTFWRTTAWGRLGREGVGRKKSGFYTIDGNNICENTQPPRWVEDDRRGGRLVSDVEKAAEVEPERGGKLLLISHPSPLIPPPSQLISHPHSPHPLPLLSHSSHLFPYLSLKSVMRAKDWVH